MAAHTTATMSTIKGHVYRLVNANAPPAGGERIAVYQSLEIFAVSTAK